MTIEKLCKDLLDAPVDYGVCDAIYSLACALRDAGEGDTAYSRGNIGVSIHDNVIDVVNIDLGTSIVTVTMKY